MDEERKSELDAICGKIVEEDYLYGISLLTLGMSAFTFLLVGAHGGMRVGGVRLHAETVQGVCACLVMSMPVVSVFLKSRIRRDMVKLASISKSIREHKGGDEE